MFRHKGKNRTYKHNLRLASLLSFIAGMVNIVGVLSFKTLTTNITGHFAFFSEELVNKNYESAFVFLAFIFSFLLGAFVSNYLVESVIRLNPRISHAAPMLIEITILCGIGTLADPTGSSAQLVACLLLFAMGLQNSLVTKVSDSVVRTTHLTGLFTDMGIELSQLFFFKQAGEPQRLRRSIYLRLVIITCFFLGCIIGGYLFKSIRLKTLLFTSSCLLIALFYDTIRYRVYRFRRKIRRD